MELTNELRYVRRGVAGVDADGRDIPRMVLQQKWRWSDVLVPYVNGHNAEGKPLFGMRQKFEWRDVPVEDE